MCPRMICGWLYHAVRDFTYHVYSGYAEGSMLLMTSTDIQCMHAYTVLSVCVHQYGLLELVFVPRSLSTGAETAAESSWTSQEEAIQTEQVCEASEAKMWVLQAAGGVHSCMWQRYMCMFVCVCTQGVCCGDGGVAYVGIIICRHEVIGLLVWLRNVI